MPVTSWHPEIIYAKVTSAYNQAAGLTTAEAKRLAPSRTGALRSSITYTPTGPLSGQIKSEVPYAAAQESGAGAHTISPGARGVLANAKLGFGPVRGPVQHPGNAAQNYLHGAAAKFVTFFLATMRRGFGI